MAKATKPKIKPPIEISDDEFSSTSSSSPLSSPCLSREDIEVEEVDKPSPARTKENRRKRNHPPSSPEKDNQNPKRNVAKARSIMASLYFPPLSPKQHLQKAIESLTQACIRLEGESKEQVKQIRDDIQKILVGENPSIKEKEKEKERQDTDILKGLVEEVKALCKEVAPKIYTEKLKKGLSSLTFAPTPSSSTTTSSFSPPPSSSAFPPTSKVASNTASTTSPTSTRGKKKQLQERRLVLVTDQKDQPLDIFSIRN